MVPARTLVVLSLVVLAGCLGTAGESAPGDGVTYETHVFDHASPEPAIEGGIRYPTADEESRPFHVTVVASADGVARFDAAVLEPEAERFVEETDFDRQFLVVVEAFPASSEPDYRIERLEWDDDSLHLFVDDSSDGGTMDVTVETLLVRVDRDGRGIPDVVTVTTDEGETFSNVGTASR